jgi:hypothetical protein
VTHTFRWLRRDRRTPTQRRAEWQFHIDAIAHNLRTFPGPREACDSPFDPRWLLNEHDEQALLALKRQKPDFHARGYTWVRG